MAVFVMELEKGLRWRDNLAMYSYEKQGMIARFRGYLRYQSRFGHERLYLSASAVALVLTGFAIWRMFAE